MASEINGLYFDLDLHAKGVKVIFFKGHLKGQIVIESENDFLQKSWVLFSNFQNGMVIRNWMIN